MQWEQWQQHVLLLVVRHACSTVSPFLPRLQAIVPSLLPSLFSGSFLLFWRELDFAQQFSLQNQLSTLAGVSPPPAVTVLLLCLQLTLLQLTPVFTVSPFPLPLTLPAGIRLALSRKLDAIGLWLLDLVPRENRICVLSDGITILRRLKLPRRANGLLDWARREFPAEEEACVIAMGDWRELLKCLNSRGEQSEEDRKHLTAVNFHLGEFDEVLRLAGVSSDEEFHQYEVCARLCKGEPFSLRDDTHELGVSLPENPSILQRERFFYFSIAQFLAVYQRNDVKTAVQILGNAHRILLEDYQAQLHFAQLQTLPQQSFLPVLNELRLILRYPERIPAVIEYMDTLETKPKNLREFEREAKLVRRVIAITKPKPRETEPSLLDLKRKFRRVEDLFSRGDHKTAEKALEELEGAIGLQKKKSKENLELLELNELIANCFHLRLNWCAPTFTSSSFPSFLESMQKRLHAVPRSSSVFPVFRSMETLFHRINHPALSDERVKLHVDCLLETLTILPQPSSLEHLNLLHHLLHCISIHPKLSAVLSERILSLPYLLWLPVLPVLLHTLLLLSNSAPGSPSSELFVSLITHILIHPLIAKRSVLTLLQNSFSSLPLSIQTVLKTRYPRLLNDAMVFNEEIQKICHNKFCKLYSLIHQSETLDEAKFVSILESPSIVLFFPILFSPSEQFRCVYHKPIFQLQSR